MEHTPLVSVIVAVYNIEHYIRRCVDSVLAQDYKQLEVILVDDGSTDSCPQICDEYAMRDSRVKVVHKKNGGLSDARNAGLDIASGAYIGFVDGDDWIDLNMYGTMVKCCEETGAQISVCRYSQYLETLLKAEDSKYEMTKTHENVDEVIEGYAIYKKMEWDEGMPTGQITCLTRNEALENFISAHAKFQIHNSVWSKLYAKEVCEDLRFPIGKNSEDIMYTTRTFAKAKQVAFVDCDFYHYVCGRAGSIMNVGRFERRLQDELPFWKEQECFLRDIDEEELADQSLFYACRRIMSYYLDAYAYEKNEKDHTNHYAKRLAREVLGRKDKLTDIANRTWVKKGDKARLQLFLMCPILYAWTSIFYEKMILPIRS